MRAYDFYWRTSKSWYHYDETEFPVVNDDAPEKAKKSYEHFLEQVKEDEQHGYL